MQKDTLVSNLKSIRAIAFNERDPSFGETFMG